MKKRIKLRRKTLIVLAVIVGIALVILFGINRYQLYIYHNSTEYKLLTKGYTQEDVDLFKEKLDKDYYESLVDARKNDNLSKILKEKYFLLKNLDRYIAYYDKFNDKSFSDIVAIVNVNADYKWYEIEINTSLDDGYSTIVNKFYNLPEGYAPDDIIPIKNWYALANNEARSDAVNAYISLWNAAKEAGYTLVVNSSFRTEAEQIEAYRLYENTKGQTYADSIAARPRHSEHQLGLALDIVNYGGKTSDFVNTPEYQWLSEHAHEYGFILRYPEGKQYLTGFAFESWHYRFLGEELPTKVYNEGITYDEYYAYYLAK